jgi:hypothetical protein
MPHRLMPLSIVAILAAACVPAPLSAQSGGTVRPDTDESAQWSASVVRVDPLRGQGELTAKLFGTAGGDPAMNGLYTYLAFFGSPDEGWRVFRLGDFLDYRLVAEGPGRLTLDIRESEMNRRTGRIGIRSRRLLVAWNPGAGGLPPALVRLIPAR